MDRAVAAEGRAAPSVSGPEAAARSAGPSGDLVRTAHGDRVAASAALARGGGGSTCYRRMNEWQRAGVWEKLHELLLTELRAAGEIEWSRAVADSSHVQAKKGAPRRARARLIEPETARSITRW